MRPPCRRPLPPVAGPLATAAAALLASACQAPFEVQRKDLGPPRVAALGVDGGVARAAVWSGLGAYHDRAPSLSWTLDGQPLGEGFDVAVPEHGTLGLTATVFDGTGSDGTVLDAVVTIAEPPPLPAVERAAVQLGEDLSLDARRAADTTTVEHSAPSGQAMRLTLAWDETPDEALSARWMTAGGLGTLLEVETFGADVLNEEVEFDDGEVVERTDLGDGLSTHLALLLDGAGSNRWLWVDAAVGVDEALVRHAGRLLPVEVSTESGLVAVTLVHSDDLWGVQPVDPEPVGDLSQQDALGCAPEDSAFRMDWLVEGRCARPEVLGARVVLEVW